MTVALTEPMRELLWAVAQRRYGWVYVPDFGGEHRAAQALHERGLVTHHLVRYLGGSIVVVTDAGRAEIRRRWPVSPCGEGTYDRSDWTLLHDDHVQRAAAHPAAARPCSQDQT